MQAVPFGFMRGVVGAIGIGCAYMLARSLVSFRKGQVRISRVYAWAVRLILCLLAVWFPSRPDIDISDVVVVALCVAAFAFSYWDSSRVKKEEDLTKEIFPDSDKEQD